MKIASDWYEGKVCVVRVYEYDLKHNRYFVLVATIADRNGVTVWAIYHMGWIMVYLLQLVRNI